MLNDLIPDSIYISGIYLNFQDTYIKKEISCLLGDKVQYEFYLINIQNKRILLDEDVIESNLMTELEIGVLGLLG